MSGSVDLSERFFDVVREYNEIIERISEVDCSFKRRLYAHVALAFQEACMDVAFDSLYLTNSK